MPAYPQHTTHNAHNTQTHHQYQKPEANVSTLARTILVSAVARGKGLDERLSASRQILLALQAAALELLLLQIRQALQRALVERRVAVGLDRHNGGARNRVARGRIGIAVVGDALVELAVRGLEPVGELGELGRMSGQFEEERLKVASEGVVDHAVNSEQLGRQPAVFGQGGTQRLGEDKRVLD